MNPNRVTTIQFISALLISLLLLAGCFNQNDGQSPQTGGVAAQIVWPDEGAATSASLGGSVLQTALVSPGFSPLDAPAGVVEIRITASGADFTSLQTSFTAVPGSPGSGTMWGIPVGTNRSISVEALNSIGTPLYQGTVIGVTITSGVAEAVTVPLSLISSIPPAIPTITLPVTSPYFTTASPITLSGACTDATVHTVNLTGDQTGSVACTGSAYSFSLSEVVQGVYGYSVTQTDDTTLLISPSDAITWILDWTAPASVGIVGPASNPETSSGSTLVLQGTCETGAAVTLSGDDTQTTTCVASAFTFTITETVNGTYNYAVDQTDPAGNVSASSTAFTWVRVSANPDTPTITSPAATPYYTSTWLTPITGGCDSSSPHTVDMAGQESGSMACASSAFSFAVTQPGSDGTYVYYISQSNAVPVTSGDATVIIVFDRAAPATVGITSPAATPYTASGATLNIAGTCESDATVTLSGADSQTTSCVSGLFVFSTSEVDDGTYTYTINQTDLAGNVSSDVTQVWVRDNAPPATPTITTPASSPFYSNAALTLSGACTSSSAHTVYLTGGATDQVACAGSSYSFLVSPGSDGTYTLNVSQTRDGTGAASSTASMTWILDTVPPNDPSITSPAAFQTVSTGNTFDITGTCDSGDIINLTGDDSQSQTCAGGIYTFTITKTVDGTYNFSVHQSDLAGNTSAVFTRQWVRDSAVPATPTFTAPGSNPYYSNTLLASIAGTCTSTVPHTVNLTGQETGSVACAGSAFSFTLADPGSDGSYSYNFSQTNDGTSAISGQATLTWVYDTTLPGSVTITTPASSPVTTTTSALTVSGVCETNATVNLTGDDTQSTTCSGGAYSFSVSKGTDGTYNFSLTQTDQAGNTALTPATQQWVRDTAAPANPTISTPASSPFYSNTTPITLSGVCNSSTAHTVNLTGQQTGSVACSASAYSFSLLDPGSDGSYVYSVSQTKDSNGLASGTVGLTWVLDTVAPSAPGITSPSAFQTVSSGNTFGISGTCNSGDIVNLTGDDSQSQTCAGGTFTFTITKTVDGTYNFSLTQSDLAGNTSGNVDKQWMRDSGVPATPTFTAPGSNPYYSNTLLASIAGTCTSAVPHTVNLTGQETGSVACASSVFSFSLADPGSDGTYPYDFTQTNDGTASTSGQATLTWVYDTTLPGSVTITTPASSPVTTTTSALTISGTCETNATVDLTGDDTQFTTCSGGAYSFSVSKGTDGTYNFSLTQTDQAGNTTLTPATLQWIRDTVAPGNPTITTTNPSLSNTTPLTLAGTCISATAHTVNLTGQQTGSVACSGSAYSFSLLDPGSDGSYAYNVSQTKDSNGLTSGTVGFTWNLDTTPPGSVTVTAPASSPVTTTTSTLPISGACETSATVNLTGDDTQSTTCSGGAYSFSVSKGTDGTYNFSLDQTDPAGNTALTPVTQQWVRDTVVPGNPTVTTPASNPFYSNTTPLIMGGACTSSTAHTVNLTGQQTNSVACSGSAYSFNLLDPGSDGSYAYNVSQTRDSNGLASGTVGFTWILDTTLPGSVTITTPASSPVTTTNSALTISGACETNATVNLTGDDTQSTTCSGSAYSFSVSKGTDGTYNFSLTQTDLAGNTALTPATQQWVRDTVVPGNPSITTTNPTLTNTAPITLNGTCISATAHTVNLTGQETKSVACSGGTYSFSLLDPGSDGSFVYNVSQTKDSNGLTSGTVGFTWNLDTTLPAAVTVTTPPSSPVVSTANSLIISGGCETGATVYITGDLADNVVCVASAYSFTANETVNGTYNYSLSQTDPAGNPSGSTTDVQWVKGQPAFTVTPTVITSAEGDAATAVSVSISTPPNGNVVVDVVSSDTTEATVDTATLTFNSGNWETAQTVNITPVADVTVDSNQTVIVALTVAGSTTDTTGYAALDPDDVSITVTDVDGFGITVIPTSGLITDETATTDSFTVVLNKIPTLDVVIKVESQDTSEVTVDSDPMTLTFTTSDWDTAQTVTVTGVNDAIVDGTQVVTVALTIDPSNLDVAYGALVPADVTVSNFDDDGPGITVSPVSGLITDETGGSDTFTVVLNKVPDGDVVIDVISQDSTEVAVDQTSLLFTTSDWFTVQTVTATGQNDAVADGNQTVTIALTLNGGSTTDTTGYAALNPADVSVLNIDNDTPGVSVTPVSLVTSESGTTASFFVFLNTQPAAGKVVVVDVVSQDTTEVDVDKASLTFGDGDWSTVQTVTVTGQSDSTVDGNQTAIVALTIDGVGTTDNTGYAALDPSDVSVLNSDIDVAGVTVIPTTLTTSEDGTEATFSVRLNTKPATSTMVEILVQSGDTSEVTVDKATLTFDELDWSTPQIVTAVGVSDVLTDGNQIVNIALITDTLITTDGNYDLVDPPDVTVTNLDNTPGVTLTPTSGLITTEAGGTDSFTVQLNVSPAVSTVVVIDVASADTGEVTVDTAQLTFTDADWSTPQTVIVTGVDDFVSDLSQVVDIDLTINTGGTTDADYDLLGPVAISVTNSGDIIEVIVTPTSGLITDEAGATDSFTVALSALPTGDVVIDVASSDTAEVTVDKSQLTFTTGDWMTTQTVTVKGVNDTATDGDQLVAIQITMNASTDTSAPEYGSPLDPTDPTVTNLDNESPNEGTPGGPVDVTGTLPAEGSVGATTSYYTVTGLSDGTDYFVSITSVSQDVELFVYPDTSSYTAGNELCSSDNFGDPRPEACIATATASTIFVIRVDILSGTTGGTYTINVTPVPVSVGAVGAPFDITSSLPGYLGGVNGTPSYYMVTGLTPLTAYRLQAGNLTGNVDWEVFSDVNFTASLCLANASSIAETCEATTTASGIFYIQVFEGTAPAPPIPEISFYGNIMAPLMDEGTTGSPVDLTGLIPYEGKVKNDTGNGSFYTVSGLVPSAVYSVELINMIGQGALEVYTDNTYITTSCTSDQAANWPESCTVTASASGIVYFTAVPGGGFSSAGATFRVLIK